LLWGGGGGGVNRWTTLLHQKSNGQFQCLLQKLCWCFVYGWREEISIDQSGFSWQEKLYCPDAKLTSRERRWNQPAFLTGNGIKYARKRIYNFNKLYEIVKSEKYETVYVFKRLIWRQKWTAGVRHGNALIVCRVLPGRIYVPFLTCTREVAKQRL